MLLDSIEHLSRQGFTFGAIVTAPPSTEYDVTPSEFDELAHRLGCDYFLVASASLPVDVHSSVQRRGITMGITVNWQYLLPSTFLDLFPDGLLNLHLGNLPDYKGNATVNWAILQGETGIDVNVHRIVAELDAGDVVSRSGIDIHDTTYVGDVLERATHLAPQLFDTALRRIAQDPGAAVVPGKQEGLRCYPRLPQDGLIDWSRPASEVCRLVRASSRPYPGAFSFLGERRVIVWRAGISRLTNFLAVPGHVLGADPSSGSLLVACGEGALELEEVSMDGQALAPAALTRSIRARFAGTPHAS